MVSSSFLSSLLSSMMRGGEHYREVLQKTENALCSDIFRHHVQMSNIDDHDYKQNYRE